MKIEAKARLQSKPLGNGWFFQVDPPRVLSIMTGMGIVYEDGEYAIGGMPNTKNKDLDVVVKTLKDKHGAQIPEEGITLLRRL